MTVGWAMSLGMGSLVLVEDLRTEDGILRLHQPALVLPGGDRLQTNVAAGHAEQRDPLADQHRNSGDDEPLNQTGAKKLLNGDPAVDVGMGHATLREPRGDLLWRSLQVLDIGAGGCGSDGATTEDENPFVPVGPGLETEDGLVGVAPDHQRVDRGNERLVAVLLTATGWKPIERAIRPGDEAVHTDSDEDRHFHDPPLTSYLSPLTYQTRTRSFSARYSFSPGFTSNAAYHGSRFRTVAPRYCAGACPSVRIKFRSAGSRALVRQPWAKLMKNC